VRLALVDHQLATIEPKTGKAALFGVHVPGLAVMAQNARPVMHWLFCGRAQNLRGGWNLQPPTPLAKPRPEVPLFFSFSRTPLCHGSGNNVP